MLQHRTGRNARGPRARLVLSGVALGVVLAGGWPAAPAGAQTSTFLYTGAQQTFVVPEGVTSVHVLAVGGRGGNEAAPEGGAGGAAAEVSGDVEVLPGQKLFVEVGGMGGDAPGGGAGGLNAFNGGPFGSSGGGGGGGASDVRLISRPEPDSPNSLFSRLIVAAGGGGGGGGLEGHTGGAGGQAGSEGASANGGLGGGAGTLEAGGIGACINRDCDGNLGAGHEGSVGLTGSGGGSGGAGLFGGAGGTSNGTNTGAGGGGGSSLQPSGGKTVIPAAASAPLVQITYTLPPTLINKGPPPHGHPSNAFTLLRPIVGHNRSITLVLDPANSGTVAASATAVREIVVKRHGKRVHKKLRFTFGTARATPGVAGALELTVTPSAAGRKALAAHKKLLVSITVTFTPPGGEGTTKKLSVTLPAR